LPEVLDQLTTNIVTVGIRQNICAPVLEGNPEWFGGQVTSNGRRKQVMTYIFPGLALPSRNNNQDLPFSISAEPVTSLHLHATAVSRFGRSEHNEMYGPIQPVEQLSFQTGASGEAREITKNSFRSKFVPRTQKALSDGLDDRRDFAVCLPTV
jgi:hypothetical protein